MPPRIPWASLDVPYQYRIMSNAKDSAQKLLRFYYEYPNLRTEGSGQEAKSMTVYELELMGSELMGSVPFSE